MFIYTLIQGCRVRLLPLSFLGSIREYASLLIYLICIYCRQILSPAKGSYSKTSYITVFTVLNVKMTNYRNIVQTYNHLLVCHHLRRKRNSLTERTDLKLWYHKHWTWYIIMLVELQYLVPSSIRSFSIHNFNYY